MIIVLLPSFYVIFLKHSANNLIRLKMLSAISLTYNRKSRGAITEKCGTPAFVFTRGIWNCLQIHIASY
jgi:hypothetical protein